MNPLQPLAAFLQTPDFLWMGAPVTRAEWLGMVLALWMVACNMRVHPLGWPLACLSSLLYAVVFFDSRLYGEAALQLFFAAMALWGLHRWLQRKPSGDPAIELSTLDPRARVRLVLVALPAWLGLGWLLARYTDSDVPYGDALPTVGSILGTWLLAQKYIENWVVWLGVNLVSVALFAYKGLWPTTLLYAVFAALSLWGWWVWKAQARAQIQTPLSNETLP